VGRRHGYDSQGTAIFQHVGALTGLSEVNFVQTV
jgi:hypothetical protein